VEKKKDLEISMSTQKELMEKTVAIDGFETLPKLFRNRVEKWGERVAMREKNFGVWESYTWNDFDRHARTIAAGLLHYDIKPDDVVGVLSEDNKEWAFIDMAVMMVGGIVNGVYPTYQHVQAAHILIDSNTKYLFVENEEQLDKYLQIADELENINKVFVLDWKGLRGFNHEKVEPLSHLYDTGEQYLKANPEQIDALIDQGKNDDVAVLVYTSGTTGKPKGSVIQHRYLLFTITVAPDPFEILEGDEMLTYLPLCHLAERVISLCMNLGHGTRINFAESSETVFQNIQELSPTVLFAVPRIWEKFYSRVTTVMGEATWIGQKAFNFALAIGMKRASILMADKKPSLGLNIAFKVVDRLIFRNIKQLLGLDKIRYLLTGAAPISAELLQWYLALGLEICEAYGQTETGLSTVTRKGVHRPGTVGKPLPGVEIKLSDENEILVSAPSLFKEYLHNEEGTKATKIDGWVHTGDVGEFTSEGDLRITDRLKDIIITAGGKNITPSLLENQLKFSPYISDAIIIGDKRKYLSCLIMIDEENVENYAQNHSIPFSDYKSLCALTEVKALIQSAIDKENTKVSSVEQIKKFRLIDILLTAEDDELTPTMKLKRSFVEKKYKPLIDQMY
jgi:long-chain acyl-CoA synthetase